MAKQYNTSLIIYLTLSFISGIFELGSVISAYKYRHDIFLPLIVVAAYQIATLISQTSKFFSYSITIIPIALVSSALLIFQNFGHPSINIFFGILLGTIAIQSLRESHKYGVQVSTAVKRSIRVIGFLCSGIMNLTLLGCICIIVTLLAAIRWQNYRRAYYHQPITGSFTSLCMLMVIHQVHYFCYAFPLFLIFMYQWKMSPTAAAGVFVIGWISYIFSNACFNKFDPAPVLIIGHLSVALCLAGIFFAQSFYLVVLLWFLTGYGGGTVYCIRIWNDEESPEKKCDMDKWENVGHVIGVLLSVLLVLLTGSLQLQILIGSTIAALTALMAVIINYQRCQRRKAMVTP